MGSRRRKSKPAVTALTKREFAKLSKSLQSSIKIHKMLADPLADFVQRTCGGQEAVLQLLRRSTHDGEAQHLAEVWEHLRCEAGAGGRGGKQPVDLDRLIDAAGLHARDFIGIISRCGWDIGLEMGKVIFAMRYPQMMQASMERATQVDGTDERRMHFQATGHLPTSKGINIAMMQNNRNGDDDEAPKPGKAPSFKLTARNVVRDLPPAQE